MMRRIALIAGRPSDSARYEEARGLHGFRVAHRVVQAATIILNLADGIVGLAVTLQLGVAHNPPNGVFRGAFDFLNRTGGSILIHGGALLVYRQDVRRRLHPGHSRLGLGRWGRGLTVGSLGNYLLP